MPRLSRIVLATTLGLITTLAVAWACALEVQLQDAPSTSVTCLWKPPQSTLEGHLSAERFHRFGSTRYACGVVTSEELWPDPRPTATQREVRAFLPRWSRHILLDWVDRLEDWTPGPFIVQGVDARGWPFPALWCAYAWSTETEPDLWYWVPHGGGIQLGDGLMPTQDADWWPRAALPCLPIWTGLSADAALYTAAWCILLAAPIHLRARRRHRRGLCIACAYDLRATNPNSPCPECGLKSRPRA